MEMKFPLIIAVFELRHLLKLVVLFPHNSKQNVLQIVCTSNTFAVFTLDVYTRFKDRFIDPRPVISKNILNNNQQQELKTVRTVN